MTKFVFFCTFIKKKKKKTFGFFCFSKSKRISERPFVGGMKQVAQHRKRERHCVFKAGAYTVSDQERE